MNKTYYTASIVFWALIAISGFLHGIARLIVGMELYYMESYIPWFIVRGVVYFAGLLLLLKYFQFQTYNFAYYSGIAAGFVVLCYLILIYKMLTSPEMAYNHLFLPMFLAVLISTAIYSVSLIVLPAKEKRWLKNAGIVSLIFCLILLSTVVLGVFFPTDPVNTAIREISKWTDVFGFVVPFLILIHFQSERREIVLTS